MCTWSNITTVDLCDADCMYSLLTCFVSVDNCQVGSVCEAVRSVGLVNMLCVLATHCNGSAYWPPIAMALLIGHRLQCCISVVSVILSRSFLFCVCVQFKCAEVVTLIEHMYVLLFTVSSYTV